MQFLHPYDISFPKFNTPDLSDTYKMVQEAYNNYKPGEIMAQGIKSAAGSIAGGIGDIAKNQQAADLNAAKVSALNRQNTANTQSALIAGAPQAQAVGPGDNGFISLSPASQPALPTASPSTNRLSAVPTPDVPNNDFISPEDQPLQPEEISPDAPDELNLNTQDFDNQGRLSAPATPDAVLTGSPEALAQSRLAAVQPSQATHSLDTPKVAPNTTGSGLLSAPVGVTHETTPGGAIVQRLNGVPVQIKQPNETKMRPLSKVEGEALTPPPPKASPTIRAMGLRNGIAPADATPDEIAIAQANKERIAAEGAAKDARGSQATERIDLRKKQLALGQERFLNTPAVGAAAKAFETTSSNYSSAQQNASIDPKIRTGADDVMLLQSIASIEQPNRSGTGHDLEMTLKAMPIGSKLKVQWDRIKGIVDNGEPANSRILDDNTVQSLVKAGQSAYNSKLETAAKHAAPFYKQAQEQGIPFMVHPDIQSKIDSMQQSDAVVPSAKTPDVSAAAEWLKANPNDPRAAAVRKKLEGLNYKP